MSSAIYYFSGTGNSLAAAKELAAELGDATLYPIPKVMRAVKESERNFSPKAETIVIVFPVYMAGLPRMVAEFAARLQVEEGKSVYGIATYGGMAGRVMFQLDSLLKKNGQGLKGGFLLKMPDNCIILFNTPSKSKQESLLRVEKLKLKEVAGMIKEGAEHAFESDYPVVNRLLSGPVYKGAIKHFKDNDHGFFVTEKCNGCGVCARVCPVGNIKIEEGKPKWQHDCEQCMACIQWCPMEAIQHSKGTEKKERYRHPDVKVEEFFS